MAGFQRPPVNKNKIEIVEEDDLDYDISTDIDDDELSDESEEKKSSTNRKIPNKSQQKVSNTPQQKVIKKTPKKEDNTSKYVIAGIVAIIIVVSVVFFSVQSSKKKDLLEKAELEEKAKNDSTNSSQEQNVKAGVPNLNGTGSEQNDDKLYDPSLITKDLNGTDVPPNYSVVNNEELIDFITYTKYRAPMGNGVEFYWLEAEYKGQPYKVQVPYSVYSKLDKQGITVVDIELLTLDNGSKMVTYMQVRKDAKALLDKNR